MAKTITTKDYNERKYLQITAEEYNSFYKHHVEDVDIFVGFACLYPGETVLDLCTGTGLVALRAEAAVKLGRVVCIDIDGGLLSQGRLAAADKGLGNIEFINGDVTSEATFSSLRPSSSFPGFDAITCLWSGGLTRSPANLSLWSELLAPGGRLVIDYPEHGDTLGNLRFELLSGEAIFDWSIGDDVSWTACQRQMDSTIGKAGLKKVSMRMAYRIRDNTGVDLVLARARAQSAGLQPSPDMISKTRKQVVQSMRRAFFEDRSEEDPMFSIPKHKVVNWLAVLKRG